PIASVTGAVTLELTAFVQGHESDTSPGWRATASQSASFVPVTPRRIQPVLVANSGFSERPTMDQFLTMLATTTPRLPVPEDHFRVLPPRSSDLSADIDLPRADDDWARAGGALRALEDGSNTIIAGVVFKPMAAATVTSPTSVTGVHPGGAR